VAGCAGCVVLDVSAKYLGKQLIADNENKTKFYLPLAKTERKHIKRRVFGLVPITYARHDVAGCAGCVVLDVSAKNYLGK
jgi:hypothetical protein